MKLMYLLKSVAKYPTNKNNVAVYGLPKADRVSFFMGKTFVLALRNTYNVWQNVKIVSTFLEGNSNGYRMDHTYEQNKKKGSKNLKNKLERMMCYSYISKDKVKLRAIFLCFLSNNIVSVFVFSLLNLNLRNIHIYSLFPLFLSILFSFAFVVSLFCQFFSIFGITTLFLLIHHNLILY